MRYIFVAHCMPISIVLGALRREIWQKSRKMPRKTCSMGSGSFNVKSLAPSKMGYVPSCYWQIVISAISCMLLEIWRLRFMFRASDSCLMLGYVHVINFRIISIIIIIIIILVKMLLLRHTPVSFNALVRDDTLRIYRWTACCQKLESMSIIHFDATLVFDRQTRHAISNTALSIVVLCKNKQHPPLTHQLSLVQVHIYWSWKDRRLSATMHC